MKFIVAVIHSYIQYICIIAIAIIIKTELLIATVPEEQGVVSVMPHEVRLVNPGRRREPAQQPM